MDKKGVSSSPATPTLRQRTLWVDGKHVRISPGMAIAAEIKTGKHRIIEFLSSPLGAGGSREFAGALKGVGK